MSMIMLHPRMLWLLELRQTRNVVEYTTAFWERLHRVLDFNPNLSTKCFILHQYAAGMWDDIQAAVRSRSPSSHRCIASALARIREDDMRKDTAMDADNLGVSDGLMPTENLIDVFPEPAAPVQCRADHSVTTTDISCHSPLTPTTCSMECSSSDATIGVFAKLAASAESGEDLETVSVIAPTPDTCSTGVLRHGRDGDSLSTVSLVLWTTTPSSKAPAEAAPTKLQQPFSILELGTLQSTRCSKLRLSDGIGVLTPMFQLDVTSSVKHQGQMLRPSSSRAENASTAHSGILEPPPSAATASNRDVVPYLTLPPLLSTLKASPTLSSGSGHAGPVGHCEALPYRGSVSRVITALVPPPVTDIMPENIHHARVCQGKPVFWPWTENQLKHLRLAPWLSKEIPVEAAVSTKLSA